LIRPLKRRTSAFDFLSPGAWIILAGAVVSSVVYVAWPIPTPPGRDFWLFSPPNAPIYQVAANTWNAAHPDPHDQMIIRLFQYQALERRLVAAFTADAPVADLVDTESHAMARAFAGPLEDVGFVDLTDRLRAEGLFETVNLPSFSLWSSKGRTFGLPHDVHPCLIGYRADIVEAAGIDVTQIETWDDFRRVLGPLIRDTDGDGRPDRYILNFWESNFDTIELLLRQAGTDFFEPSGRPLINTEVNARTLASLVSWIAGPDRFCVDAREFTAGGDRMRLEGTVVASILPDWLAGTWKNNIPGLAGKVKLMKMPAWERGGRRTSVSGGTCMGIPKAAPDVERAWAMAKHLYLSPTVAQAHFRSTCIISPVKTFWNLTVYHEPDPYFSGQKVGELYISEAPNVPTRSSSPFLSLVIERLMSILVSLKAEAVARQEFGTDALLPSARKLLADAQLDLARRADRNVFYTERK
jgi:arabinosaccharide transport system substrate-binding protein